jgi:hypothetical protein
MDDQEKLHQQRVDELRKEIAIGADQLDRGEVVLFDAKAIKAEGRRLLESRREERQVVPPPRK